MIRKLIACILLILTVVPLRAQDSLRVEAPTDTVRFTPQQLIVPGAMVAAGALFVAVPPLAQSRKWVGNEIGMHNVGSADDYLRFLPLLGYEVLDFAGVKSRRPFVDRVIVGATATLLTTAVTYGIKYSVKEMRPNGESEHSFPSGHASIAFMGAELLRQDYGPWVGAGGYVVATGIGVMRIIGGAHWFNDVLAGAGIGILCARAAEWLLPFNRRWLGLDKKHGESAVIVPAYSPAFGAVTLNAAFTF